MALKHASYVMQALGCAPMTATSHLGASSFDGVKVGKFEGQILMLSPATAS